MDRRTVLMPRVVPVMLLFVLAFFSYSCATAQQGKRITPDEAAWIETGRTTRAEVVARLGLPRVEFPQSSGFISVSTTTQLQGHPRLRKATYVSTHRDTAGFPFYGDVGVTQSQFWVVYDDEGVVRDFGFMGPQLDVVPEGRQKTIANVLQPPDIAAENRYQP